MKITALTPAIGAEVRELDVSVIDDLRFQQLRDAWLQHKVLFLRHQDLSLDDLVAIGQRLGELMRLPYIRPLADYPDVIGVIKEADEVGRGVFGGEWHSDFSFLSQPPAASLLYSVDVPPLGGDTLWVNMALAWQRLDPRLQQKLHDAVAVHSGKPYGIANAPDESTQVKGAIAIERNNPDADQEVGHPAVRHIAETGESILFVNPTYTVRLEGPGIDDSHAILDALYRHCTRPEFCCRWKWEPGVLAIWDNRSTLHYAVDDYDGIRREMYRVTTRGEVPLAAA